MAILFKNILYLNGGRETIPEITLAESLHAGVTPFISFAGDALLYNRELNTETVQSSKRKSVK